MVYNKTTVDFNEYFNQIIESTSNVREISKDEILNQDKKIFLLYYHEGMDVEEALIDYSNNNLL